MSSHQQPPRPRKLAEEHLPATNWSKLWLNILGTLLLVMVINSATSNYLNKHTPNKGYWIISNKWDTLLQINAPVDTLVLGDSSALQGFIPEVWQAETGEQALNQATIGSLGALNDAWMLQVYLARFGPPKRVIVIHIYDIWYRQVPSEVLHRIPIRSYRGQRLQPPIKISWQEQLAAVALRLPLYSENLSLRHLIMTWLENPLDWQSLLVEPFQLEPGGYDKLIEPEPETVQDDLLVHYDFLAEQSFEISPINQASVNQMVELSEQYGFDLYFVNGPLVDVLYQDPAFQAYFTDLSAYFEDLAMQHEPVHFAGIVATFPASQLESVDHAVYQSAVIYTRQLADEIFSIER